MSFEAFHFLRPAWLLLLLPLAWLLWQLLRQVRFATHWQAACDSHLLPHLLTTAHKPTWLWPLILLGIAWLLSVLALAGPTWSRISHPVYRLQTARVILLDLSKTMYANDVAPNRLTRAKYKVLDLLQQSREGQVGLIVFSGEPHVVSPLTQDATTIASMVPVLTPSIMPVSGNQIGLALKKAAELLRNTGIKQGQIILITSNVANADDVKIAQQLAQQGLTTSILGIGTNEGAPIPTRQGFDQDSTGQIKISKLDTDSLKKLATAGQGIYTHLTNDDQDIMALASLDSLHQQSKQAVKTQMETDVWQDQGQWLVFPILILTALAFRRGWFSEVIK